MKILKKLNSARIATSVSAVALALASLAPSHAVAAASVTAVLGWNLLGYSDTAAVNVVDAFGNNDKVTSVWKWDATNSKWAFYSPSFATPTALSDYAATKGYAVLTTINGGEGFWVNAKTPFTATLPAPQAQVVNPAALAGIQTGMAAFASLFATAVPTASAVTPMFDTTMLNSGKNQTEFATAITTAGNGPSIGFTFSNIALVNPLDGGAIPNDSTHQWFTFDMTNNSGSQTPWLAVKNSASNWLIAGDQRLFNTNVEATAVRHIPSSQQQGMTTTANQIDLWGGNPPASVSSIVVTGPGVTPSTGVAIYSASATQKNIHIPTCGVAAWFSSNVSANCMDVSAATAGAQYAFKIYTTAGGTSTPAYTYVNALARAPLNAAGLASAAFPGTPTVSGNWASNGSVTVSWTLPEGMKSDNVSIGAWSNGTNGSYSQQLFQQDGPNFSGTETSATMAVPTYTGTIGGKNVWLSTRDATGNRVALDLQLAP